MESISISINPIFLLIAIAIFAAYKIYQDKNAIPNKTPKELNLKEETNEIKETACIQKQNFTKQNNKEEYNKINDRIALTNLLLLIIAIALIIIAFCTVQEYLYKKDIIDYTNKTINELYEILN